MMKRISIIALLVLSAVVSISINRASGTQDEKPAPNQSAADTKTQPPPEPTPAPNYPLAPLRRDFKDSLPIKVGEKLEYEVKFSRLIFRSVTVGIVTFEYQGPVTIGQPPVKQSGDNKIEPVINGLNMEFNPAPDDRLLRLRATAVPKGFLITMFTKDSKYRYESLVNANNFSARLNVLEIQEGDKHNIQSNIFDIANQNVKYLTTDLANKQALPRERTLPYQEGMMSLLSAIYFVRFQKYKEGQLIQFPVSSEENNYVFDILVGKRKKIKTECGQVWAVPLEPKIFGPNKYFSKLTGNMTLWMSDDNKHVPLMLHSKTSKGTINAKLIKKNCRIIEPDIPDEKQEAKTAN
ncbi:MAG: DUF3108 domain-containing protein [Acidobacteria bacterium]|nr:DUF3108 domain-containing protein [Acidobacteriota bacterium]